MQFCWTTINVRDLDKSLAFYQEIVGLEISRRFQPNPDIEIVFLGDGDTKLELIHNKKIPAPEFGRDISLGFTLDSLEEFMDFLKIRNIPVASGPFQPNPFMKFIFVLDPDGLKIQFVENLKP